MGKYTEVLNQNTKRRHADYERQLYQTYLTVPEWRNVEMAQELGTFLKEGHAFYRFPFFRQLFGLWGIFVDSYRTARRHHTVSELIFSEYMLMNVFISAFTTVSFILKGILSLLLYPVLNRKNKTAFQDSVADLVTEYANFLQHTPFYYFNYLSKLSIVYNAFWLSPNKTLADVVSLCVTTIELLCRHAISAPIAWWYSQPQNAAADRIHLLIKVDDPLLNLKRIDKEIKIIEQWKKTDALKQNQYYHITVPRYATFQKIATKLVRHDVKFKKIAGQDKIQFKIELTDDKPLERYHVLYAYRNYIDNKKIVEIDVTTKEFNQTVRNLRKDRIRIRNMHDF
ncbi:hypothetical protein CC99x_003170 [Candidatus Berkiella cookevillensis]|uniref:Uncharacterized protein n=1 Tax=Candidatus Berkiella cookevillensis TaxID=437022 RepID=A0A0Q9YMQ5_9GAMM|nr:hypothetical protein [Candidatus Berkiella cookevillensis]MCS5707899.1 hypothetical protein [Candidatus Berkiella cookevillensis]